MRGALYAVLTQAILLLARVRECAAGRTWKRQVQRTYVVESFAKEPEQYWECCDCGLTHVASKAGWAHDELTLAALRPQGYGYRPRWLAVKSAPYVDRS